MSALQRLVAVLVVALFAGCTLPAQKEEAASPPETTPVPVEDRLQKPPAPPQPEVRLPGEQERAVSYFDRLRRMQVGELAREQEAVRQAYGQSRSDFDRMRLAMTYALPNTPLSDEGRALDLLEPLVRNIRAELHPLAVLLAVFVQEHKRLAANIQTLQQGVQSLQQKLDALRSLERSLIEREGGAARRK
jgi:outer membrane murein-binding lipoprotein Lpp